VAQAVEAARSAGLDNISLDLIYGLPGQTMEQWQQNLAAAVALNPQHLSCYGLKVEEGTPLARMTHLSIPGDELQAEMYLYTTAYLAQQGLAQYEISNFAKPGQESRHNLKYWTLGEYMGFGPGAHSDFGGTRYAYGRDLAGYIRGVLDGTLAVSEAESIPLRERDTEYIMLSLRTAAGISRHVFEHTFRQRFAPLEQAFLSYEKAGLAARTDEGWRLTANGFLLSNTIISQLWEIHGNEKQRRAEAAAKGDFRIEW
jgi:oxygen-independent coproporphyrinogen-3 oxidase